MRETIRFNNLALFASGEHTLVVDSWQRESMERGFAGLGGAFSVDLGKRTRRLEQRGELSAESGAALRRLTESIAAYADGQVYELTDRDGATYPSVRIDRLRILHTGYSGSQVRCSYEIIYTQLSD